MDEALDVVEIEIVADVAIELAVVEIAGIAFGAAPDLLGGIRIAPEGGYSGGTLDGRVDSIPGADAGVCDAVGFEDGVADAVIGENPVEARIVAAFGEPEALGRAAE